MCDKNSSLVAKINDLGPVSSKSSLWTSGKHIVPNFWYPKWVGNI